MHMRACTKPPPNTPTQYATLRCIAVTCRPPRTRGCAAVARCAISTSTTRYLYLHATVDNKVWIAYLMVFPAIAIAALANGKVVPYELRWVGGFAMVDVLRKLFKVLPLSSLDIILNPYSAHSAHSHTSLKLNTEAIGLILYELDFHIPFTTNAIAMYFAAASFGYEIGAVIVIVFYSSFYTVNVLLGTYRVAVRCNRASYSKCRYNASTPIVVTSVRTSIHLPIYSTTVRYYPT